jgi:hypothetical protein
MVKIRARDSEASIDRAWSSELRYWGAATQTRVSFTLGRERERENEQSRAKIVSVPLESRRENMHYHSNVHFPK